MSRCDALASGGFFLSFLKPHTDFDLFRPLPHLANKIHMTLKGSPYTHLTHRLK